MNHPQLAYISFLKVPLLALAFTPLIFYEGAIFPFIFPKTLFIRVMLTLFWVGLAALLLHQLYQLYKRRSASSHQRKSALFDIRANQRLLRNPIFLAVAVFMLLASISTIFAENPYRAFWGDVERGEGLVRLLYFFGFFIGALLVFAPKDWKIFFGLTVLSGAVLFAMQIFTPMTGSLIGNTAFLSAFYLFAIFAAAMLLAGRKSALQENFRAVPRSASRDSALLKQAGLILMILIFAAGIFLAGTRGAILGLAVGIIAILLFFALYRRKSADTDINPRLRRTASGLLILFLVLTAAFVLTRQAPLWQNIPGLARIAGISLEDPTFQTRLIATGIGINAVNPQNEGVFRTLVGWGPENFSVAYQKYFDPRYFRYEALWFDRAHNKLIDVLVMNGLLGLISYITVWFLVFRVILRKVPSVSAFLQARNSAEPYTEQRGNEPLEKAALLFFAAAYFTQNLFVFENISLYIPFFAFLGFLASRGTRIGADGKTRITADNKTLINADKISANQQDRLSFTQWFFPALVIIPAWFFITVLVVTLIALSQMRGYTIPLLAGRADQIVANFERITRPYTYIQPELRSLFAQTIFGSVTAENINAIRPFLTMAAEAMKEAAERERTNARYFLFTASAYEVLGDLEQAKKHQRRALELAPQRQDVLYTIASREAKSRNKEAALYYAEKMKGLDPEVMISRIHYAVVLALAQGVASFEESAGLMLSVFEGPKPFRQVSGEIAVARQVFDFYIREFYSARDSEQFLKALQKLKLFEERYDASVRFHSPDAPPSAEIPKIQRRIDAFIAEGWEGVQF